MCGSAGGEPWRFQFKCEVADIVEAFDGFVGTPIKLRLGWKVQGKDSTRHFIKTSAHDKISRRQVMGHAPVAAATPRSAELGVGTVLADRQIGGPPNTDFRNQNPTRSSILTAL